MKLRSLIKATLFLMILLTAVSTNAQNNNPAPGASPVPTPSPVDIVYTGRLFGYFRTPSLQDINDVSGCPNVPVDASSDAAKRFLEIRKAQDQNQNKTVLVGTGDNFAPQLEAREFDVTQAPGTYAVGNKELYLGSPTRWVPYKEESTPAEKLRNDIAGGFGTIPNDNVACFLRRAKYAAIVPGKHDFYFGAERVREFARFLAADEAGEYKPVQMLGANLVMKTVPIEESPVSAKVKADHPAFKEWPDDYPVLNLNDGASVYPWFSVVKIQLAKIPPAPEATFSNDLKNFIGKDGRDLNTTPPGKKRNVETLQDVLKNLSATVNSELQKPPASAAQTAQLTADKNRLIALEPIFDALKKNLDTATGKFSLIQICPSKGNPNELDLTKCEPTMNPKLRMDGNKLVLDVYLQPKFHGKNGHFSTLMFGENFGLCTTMTNKKTKKPENACMRFSSHTPFFNFPHEVAYDNQNGYNDPEPYVLKDNVAIFGVVDPSLGEQVGVLNFGWRSRNNPELTTHLSAEDPADALQQLLDYYNVQHHDLPVVKVLLAQMTPQHARALAARFPEFQVVVAAADRDLATSNITLSSTWKPDSRSSGAFLAVPTPYFDPATRNGAVHMGIIKANPNNREWNLSAAARAGDPITEDEDPAPNFWARIKALDGCLPSNFNPNAAAIYDNQTYLKWLVLCTMQQQLQADVALIQTQDLFDKIPKLTSGKHVYRMNANAQSAENVQQMLNRVIWKGDLLTLLYVPGKALKKALDKSAEFEEEENATLALSVDRGRKLETLGVKKKNGEYFVNGLPLDDERLYTIATTDYIGAGDTGYPDLENAARNPRSHPAAYTGNLIPISSLVCRRLFPANPAQYCLDPIDSDKYLDETIAKQIPPYPPEGSFSSFWSKTNIALPKARDDSNDPGEGVEYKVRRRSFWGFSLKNFSIGFKDLDNNRTDKSLNEKFAGIPGISSAENRTISTGLDTRLSYFADRKEFYIGTGIDYERQSQGDPTVATGISLNKNRFFGDIGLVLWRRPGREFPNTGVVFSLHGETQLEAPFSAFNLNTPEAEQIRITQKRGALALGRLGFRWENRTNTFEIGGQGGREFRALRGYHFENPGDDDVECLVNSAQTLSACINDKSESPNGLITANSIPTALLQARPRAGMYWNHTLSFPLGSRMKYELTQDADFFFVNFHLDTTIDTRFRYNSKNRLSFLIWPNFSIGPTLELFMYQNKVNRNFLFQRTLGIETKLNFDIFNRREKKAQVIARE